MLHCLSLWQPWASLIAIGAKRIETRHYPIAFRGEIAIHATKTWQRDCLEIALTEPFLTIWRENGVQHLRDLPTGAIVAVAEMTACREIGREFGAVTIGGGTFVDKAEIPFGDFTEGRYAWILTDIRRLPTPVPARGAQMLWTATPAVESAVRAQLEANRV